MSAAHASAPPTWRFQRGRLIPQHELRELELCNALTAEIPAKLTHTLICSLGNHLPLTDLKHLKRVRKVGDKASTLDMIIAGPELTNRILQHLDTRRTSSPGTQRAHYHASDTQQATPAEASQSPASLAMAVGAVLPAAVNELITQHSLPLRVQQVPAQPPQTRKQWEAWGSQHWPMAWKIPEGSEPPTGDQLLTSSSDQAYFEQHLTALLNLTQQPDGGSRCPGNAARIVDPLSGRIVAEACDCRLAHPLHHAVMVAVQAAAQRDLQLWPENHDCDREEGSIPMHIDSPTAAQEDPQVACRQHAQTSQNETGIGKHALDGTGGEGVQGEEEGSTTLAHKRLKTCDASIEQGGVVLRTSNEQWVEATGRNASVTGGAQDGCGARAVGQGVVGPRPYMCTGYDCFLVHEPCVMCAMALVHSRLSRVIYCKPDAKAGALGGAFNLMRQRSLNHHYQVFVVELV